MMVGFQCQSVLFCHENSKMVGFVWLQDLNDSLLSVSLGFVPLRDFTGGRFYSVMRFQSRLFYSVMRF